MPVSAPDVVRSEVTVPLTSFIQPYHSHYFSGRTDRPHFRQRDYSFPGIPDLMPLTRLFLDTCAADCTADYRYLFTLLGSELANNAIRHSRSGLPGGFYDLQVRRSAQGMHLTCRDRGSVAPIGAGRFSPDPDGLDPDAEAGRGLAMVDALATAWGDNGLPEARNVWFFLARDLDGTPWSRL
ncbi:histidine kinase [Nocardiopsis sp. CNR-923]|uniref:ATP-binding protein n=1 Tax=Nocardiopsis sp. CNR-923 TaxID=1904965 RepID=UPI000965B9D3|nr:ATP-binding protein [Nocardiopsis sp. CNR-923]OLT24666.1 histidine kinase [Nocardiopsis sp. CNR-923]